MRQVPPPGAADPVALALAGMRRVAVVGLSPDPRRESHQVATALQRAGWTIVPVNPTVDEVLGERSWPDLASVPGRIDVVDVFRRAEHLPNLAREAVERDDVAVVWNQLGLRSGEAAAIVADADRAYVEDRCLMIEVARHGAGPPAGPRVEADVLLVDLDGTVLDYHRAERRALVDTLTDVGVDADDETVATYRRINREHWGAFERGELTGELLRSRRWVAFLAERGVDVDGRDAARAYLDRLAAAGDVLAGAREALWWLGRRMCLVAVTNGFDDVQRGRLAAAGLVGAFDGYVSSEGAGVAKPDPAIAAAALATLDGAARTAPAVAIVGDSLVADVALGAVIGATSVWVTSHEEADPSGPAAPDHRVARLADIA